MGGSKFSEYDKNIMGFAIRLAEKARGLTSPNPMVGAVIVKDGRIISSGYHKKAGGPHAEIEAIDACPDKKILKSAKLYVTMEPCSIYGKTPPCTDAIIKYGFSEVIIGSIDPNPRINGRGIKILENAGIKVRTGLLKEKIARQNEFFFKHIVSARPFITLKIASSIDGKIAAKSGDSKWITCNRARNYVHKIRKEHDCILTGINTIINDDPLLYPRKNPGSGPDLDEGKKYYRAILDASLRTGNDSNIVKTAGKIKTIIFVSNNASIDKKKLESFIKLGVEVIKIPAEKTMNTDKKTHLLQDIEKTQKEKGLYPVKLRIPAILKKLYEDYNVTSIIIESGPTLATEFLRNKLIDKFLFFISPRIIGGDSNYSMFGGLDILKVGSSIKLNISSKKSIGEDILIIAYPENVSKGARCLQES